MSLLFHIRTLVVAVVAWAAFFVAGLPDYYQQYPLVGMILFCAALVPAVWRIALWVTRRAPVEHRPRLAAWVAFYFTVPLALLDYAYCGIYLGHGLAFLSIHAVASAGVMCFASLEDRRLAGRISEHTAQGVFATILEDQSNLRWQGSIPAPAT